MIPANGHFIHCDPQHLYQNFWIGRYPQIHYRHILEQTPKTVAFILRFYSSHKTFGKFIPDYSHHVSHHPRPRLEMEYYPPRKKQGITSYNKTPLYQSTTSRPTLPLLASVALPLPTRYIPLATRSFHCQRYSPYCLFVRFSPLPEKAAGGVDMKRESDD